MQATFKALASAAAASSMALALGGGPLRSEPPLIGRDTSAADGQLGGAFTYQGHLRKDGRPHSGVCDASFYLYGAPLGGFVMGSAFSPTLSVRDGLFTIDLDFGALPFTGEARWLETEIGCGETPVTLSPRTRLNAAPYAIALPGMRTVPGNADIAGRPTINVIGGVISGSLGNAIDAESYNGVVSGGFNNAIAGGSIHGAILGGWGNAISGGGSYGAIGGGYANGVSGAAYAAISGGEQNAVQDSPHAAIGGGAGNRVGGDSNGAHVGGGSGNGIAANSDNAAIAGGSDNLITGTSFSSFIGPGGSNRITGHPYGVIAGGQANALSGGSRSAIGGGQANAVAASTHAVIGGGSGNVITGAANYATIPGGLSAAAVNYGQFALASGTFGSTPGLAQHSTYVLRTTTPANNTWVELFLDGAIRRIAIAPHRAMIFYIQVVGFTQDDWVGAWEFRGVIKNSGPVPTQGCVADTCFVTTPTKTVLQPMAAGEDATVMADFTNDSLSIQARGNVYFPMHWVATVYATEVGW